jgi:NADH-quinone oxidoreductase subunit M
MPDQLFFPLASLGVFLPLGLALVVWKMTGVEQARRWTAGVLATSFIALLAAGLTVARAPEGRFTEPFWQWFVVDALNAVPLSLFTAMALGVAVLAPKGKLTPQWLAGLLWMCAMTNAAYAANNLIVFVAGWAGSLAPFLLTRAFARPASGGTGDIETAGRRALPGSAQVVLAASLVSLCIGVALLVFAASGASLHDALGFALVRKGDSWSLFAAFAFLMGAVVLRKGIFPAHFWVVTSFERGSLLLMTLLMNGHLGAFLIARVVLPLLPDVAHRAWPLFSNLGLFTAAYAALLAILAGCSRWWRSVNRRFY